MPDNLTFHLKVHLYSSYVKEKKKDKIVKGSLRKKFAIGLTFFFTFNCIISFCDQFLVWTDAEDVHQHFSYFLWEKNKTKHIRTINQCQTKTWLGSQFLKCKWMNTKGGGLSSQLWVEHEKLENISCDNPLTKVDTRKMEKWILGPFWGQSTSIKSVPFINLKLWFYFHHVKKCPLSSCQHQ